MRRVLAVILALAAPLLFPALLAFLIVCAASVVVPPIGILAGVLADALYRAPQGPPYATLLGILAAAFGYLMQRFIKTRIMGA